VFSSVRWGYAGPIGTAAAAPADAWNRVERAETRTQRLDRNWAGLLQELRVVLTGVQLLTGFLLTLPFQQRFAVLDDNLHEPLHHGRPVLAWCGRIRCRDHGLPSHRRSPASIVAGLSTMTALAVLWVLLPLVARRGTSPDVLDS
jgi:hypothetical protein